MWVEILEKKMKNFLNDFRSEITDIYKSYRINHFSLYYTRSTYSDFKDSHSQINNFKVEDSDLNEVIDFSEENVINDTSEYGKYQKISGGLVLVMFYQLWEDKYRKLIADNLAVEKNDLKNDLFGELRYLRQSIVHNHFAGISDLKKLKILKFIVCDDFELKLSSAEISKLYYLVIQEIENLKYYPNKKE